MALNKLLFTTIKLNVAKLHFLPLFLMPITAVLFISCNDHKKESITSADDAEIIELDHKNLWTNQDQDSTGLYSFYRIGAIKVDRQNNIYIVDSGNNRIMKYNTDGQFIKQIGKSGQGPGELISPWDLDFDEKGNLYVTNTGNNRIEIFDINGEYLNSFNIEYAMQHYRRSSIEVSPSQKIFLNFPESGYLISVYSVQGQKLNEFGMITQYDTPLEIKTFNIGHMEFEPENEVLYFVFENRPILHKYTKLGKLLFIKSIEGGEVASAFESWRQIQHKHRGQPNVVTSMWFFFDTALLPNKHLMASTLEGAVFYEFDIEGNVTKKYVTSLSDSAPVLGRIACNENGIIYTADISHGQIKQFANNSN